MAERDCSTLGFVVRLTMEIRREKAEKGCAIIVREPGLEDSCPGGFKEWRLGMGGRPHEGRNGPRERLRPREVVLGPVKK